MADATADNVVTLTGLELGAHDLSLEALQAAALAHARTHFQGRDVVNTATGWVIGFGQRGLNKTLNHGARREHLQFVPALPAYWCGQRGWEVRRTATLASDATLPGCTRFTACS